MQNENDEMKIVRLGQKEFEGSWSKGAYMIAVFFAVIIVAIAVLWPRADKTGQMAPMATNPVVSNQSAPAAAMPAEPVPVVEPSSNEFRFQMNLVMAPQHQIPSRPQPPVGQSVNQ